MAKDFPSLDILNLVSTKLTREVFSADRFRQYRHRNPHVQHIHKHSFYHMVLFTKGSGRQILDFQYYPVQPGIIYFMKPNQVHHWIFDGEEEPDGYVINFTPAFFDLVKADISILESFTFFRTLPGQQVFHTDGAVRKDLETFFEKIWEELQPTRSNIHQSISIFTQLLQIFITADREIEPLPQAAHAGPSQHIMLLNQFLNLIEVHYKTHRLPKDYASLLHVTTPHLNAVSKALTGTTAGDHIRNRILLEAKRMLVHFDNTISHIALDLDFRDVSYFVKFFKKHTGYTPEAFRRQHL